ASCSFAIAIAATLWTVARAEATMIDNYNAGNVDMNGFSSPDFGEKYENSLGANTVSGDRQSQLGGVLEEGGGTLRVNVSPDFGLLVIDNDPGFAGSVQFDYYPADFADLTADGANAFVFHFTASTLPMNVQIATTAGSYDLQKGIGAGDL